MKVLVTGARGFIGKNLVVALRRRRIDVAEVELDSPPQVLREGVRGASLVYHLAGVNRPQREEDFVLGNVGSVESMTAAVQKWLRDEPGARPPVLVLTSSSQAVLDNPYGRSKLAAEHCLEEFSNLVGAPAVIYRLPGVFGKWCRPDYNSVVATFCHRIARDLPITVSDPDRVVELVYIDDVVAELATWIDRRPQGVARGEVGPTFKITLGELAERLRAFRASRSTLEAPDTSDPFIRRLLGTYTSYLPATDLIYALQQRSDDRGTLAELLKSPHFGQIFISRTRPGITRGHHYHDTKVEKFAVVEGEAVVRFRSILGDEVFEYSVTGPEFRVLDIPPGYTHSITNVGNSDLVVLFWASEPFDAKRPDTFPEEV